MDGRDEGRGASYREGEEGETAKRRDARDGRRTDADAYKRTPHVDNVDVGHRGRRRRGRGPGQERAKERRKEGNKRGRCRALRATEVGMEGWMDGWECRNSRIEIRCCSSSSLLPHGDAAIARASHPDPSLSPIGSDVSKGAIDGAMLRPGPEERNRCQRSSSWRCLVGIPISSIVVAVSIQGCFAIVYSSPRESARPAGK